MKVLILTDRMELGGAETHIADLITGLQKEGVTAALLSGGGALTERLKEQGVRHYPVRLPTHDPWRLLLLRRRVRRLIRREGFAIAHAHTRLTAFLLRGCEKYGAIGIVTVHARFRVDSVLRRLCHWGTHTIAVSEDLKRYVCENYALSPTRVTVIPNGIDVERFAPRDTKRNTARILFASRLDEDCARGAELLCLLMPRLVERFPTATLTIAGGGDAFLRIQALAQAVNRALPSPAVNCIGTVSDMPPLLQAHTLFVGVSRAALEAAASGLPTILCGNEGYFGILTPDNFDRAAESNFCARGCENATEEALLHELSVLLSDPVRNAQAASCRARIAKEFDTVTMCRRTEEVYRAALQRRRVSLTVCGYFGCGNLGDDAILSCLLTELRARLPELRITVLSGSPRKTRRLHGVHSIGRKNPLAVFLSLLRSDALLFGGGSLLQDLTGSLSLFYYLTLMHAAALLQRPVLFTSAGIGPLLGEKNAHRVKNTLDRVAYISLRDGDSLRLLHRLGVDPAKLHASADPALLLPAPTEETLKTVQKSYQIPHDRPLLCIALHGAASCKEARRILIETAEYLASHLGLLPLYLLFDRREDRLSPSDTALIHTGRVIVPRDASEAQALLSLSTGLISMRLHALILAAPLSLPAVGVSSNPYEGKLAAFCREIGYAHLFPDRLSVAVLAAAAEEMLASAPASRPLLADAVEEAQKKLKKDLANIAEMIYNNRQNYDCEDLS